MSGFKNNFFFFVFFILLMIVIFTIQWLFYGIILNFSLVKLNIFNINFKILKNIFSFQFYFQIFSFFLKIFVIFLIITIYFKLFFLKIIHLTTCSMISCLKLGIHLIYFFLIFILIGLIPIVFFEVFYKTFYYYKNLQMSYQELQDEYKETEGYHCIKKFIRKKNKISNHMFLFSNTSTSSIVITNTISYSIAIQYDVQNIYFPKILEKGFGTLSYKIQELARKYNILVLHDAELANILYKYGTRGQCVPNMLLNVMSEVLIWMRRLEKWKKYGGKFPERIKKSFISPKLKF
ncbi:EscU/YscU/HrcU family type III secretion system export apparatus switch protein [Buchnera aphidicola]|uniref:EscU/YscU/HrcU family type III secretion system export apparatus switch protein n=1 Tax=Buchnera aphidicola TaxID=9 RepID=UPI003463BD64